MFRGMLNCRLLFRCKGLIYSGRATAGPSLDQNRKKPWMKYRTPGQGEWPSWSIRPKQMQKIVKAKRNKSRRKDGVLGHRYVRMLVPNVFLFLMREQMEFGQVLPEASHHWRDKRAGCSAHANASLDPSTTAQHRLENHGYNVSFWMTLE